MEFTPLLEIETIFRGDGGKKMLHITVQAMTACFAEDMWKVAMNRYGGEPTLEEVLSDPIVHRLMQADGINMLRLCEIMVKATLALASPSRAILAACAGA